MAVYYVDSRKGKKENDGLSEKTPTDSYRSLGIKPGDTVLLAAGSVFRDRLYSPDGEADAPIKWDVYGDGEKPEFWGSVDISGKENWVETAKNVWRYTGAPFENEPCNLIFDDSACGVLAWAYEDLDKQGKWHYTHIGYDRYDRVAEMPERLKNQPKALYLYSEGNPGGMYRHIECALYYNRIMMTAARHVTFQNIGVRYGGCHGFATLGGAYGVTLRGCEFRFIGGAVWERRSRVRFGNGVENWEYGEDFTVENCLFEEIYDSCTTHQGMTERRGPSKHIVIRGNTFKNYGMAAYELRDMVTADSVFKNNVCLGAGLGFSLQGETPPRKSELWPQPMGHHLFIWRIKGASEGGSFTVRGNVFGDAPYGAAVYSTASEAAERQIRLCGNTYRIGDGEDPLLVRWNGKNYRAWEFGAYLRDTGNDTGSRLERVNMTVPRPKAVAAV